MAKNDEKRQLREEKRLIKRRGNKRLRKLGRISNDSIEDDEYLDIIEEHIDKYNSKKYNGLDN